MLYKVPHVGPNQVPIRIADARSDKRAYSSSNFFPNNKSHILAVGQTNHGSANSCPHSVPYSIYGAYTSLFDGGDAT